MPIIIPTAAEIERMDQRQRIALAKRLPATRRELTHGLAALTLTGLDPFPPRSAVLIATTRAAGSAEEDRARQLLAEMPEDPDAAQHTTDLHKAIASARRAARPNGLRGVA